MKEKFIIYFTVFIAFSRSSFIGEIMPLQVYYGWFGLVAFYILISFLKEKRINYTMLLFIIVAVLSIIVNDINEIFSPWMKLISFIIFMIAIGPLVENKLASKFKVNLFKASSIFIIFISVLSFVGYILNLSFINNSSGFSGLTNQSMLLGPIAGLSSLIALNLIFNSKNSKYKLFYIALISISILTCLLAASRGALVSLFISILVFLYLHYKSRIGKLIKIAFAISFIIIATSSIWLPYASNVINKSEARRESDNLFSNRQTMVIDRIEDFKESPLFGVGFASMRNIYHSKFSLSGVLEPGSGWLFIISTMGLLGLILFLKLMIYPAIQILKKDLIKSSHSLIISVLIFFALHLIIEGYMLSTGGFLFFYLWLTIGVAQKRVLVYL